MILRGNKFVWNRIRINNNYFIRFYKNPDKLRNVLHVGTVIEGSAEYKSARLTNKERRQTLVQEVMADVQLKSYSKRKYSEIQREKSNKRSKRIFAKPVSKNSLRA